MEVRNAIFQDLEELPPDIAGVKAKLGHYSNQTEFQRIDFHHWLLSEEFRSSSN